MLARIGKVILWKEIFVPDWYVTPFPLIQYLTSAWSLPREPHSSWPPHVPPCPPSLIPAPHYSLETHFFRDFWANGRLLHFVLWRFVGAYCVDFTLWDISHEAQSEGRCTQHCIELGILLSSNTPPSLRHSSNDLPCIWRFTRSLGLSSDPC